MQEVVFCGPPTEINRREGGIQKGKPAFDGSHARAVTLAIFKHSGMRHPLAGEHFRAYSMAVNA